MYLSVIYYSTFELRSADTNYLLSADYLLSLRLMIEAGVLRLIDEVCFGLKAFHIARTATIP